MWLPISTITTICLLIELDFAEANMGARGEDALESLFVARSPDDWAKVWHTENHSRCRERLIRHLYWACEKDIYRLTRRNGGIKSDETISKRSGGIDKINNEHGMMEYPWMSSEEAHAMLRTRRNEKPTGSITQECCTRVGCTWEEYAEYCPSNKRLNQF